MDDSAFDPLINKIYHLIHSTSFSFLVVSLFQEIYLQCRLQMNDLKSVQFPSRQYPPQNQYPVKI